MDRDELEERLRPLIGVCPGGVDNCPLRQRCTCNAELAAAMTLIDEYTGSQNVVSTELWTAEQVAEVTGQRGGAPAARSWLSRNKIERVTTRPHPDTGRPQSLYLANEVRAVCIMKGIT